MKDWPNIPRWDKFYLGMAEYVSTASKDPSTQVGAVLADSSNRVLSVGFNGFPRGISDDSRLHDRETKYQMVVHAEVNALMFARETAGSTLYTCPFMPCSNCAALIVQAGVKRVVAPYNDNPRWAMSFKLTRIILREAGVELCELS